MRRSRPVPAGPARIAVLCVRLALLAHPRAFRRAYGAEMLAYYREAWRDAAGRGAFAGFLLTLRTAACALRVGTAQRLRGRGSTHLTHAADTASPPARRFMGSGWQQDVRVAVRAMVRQPGFSLVVIATLALGIGANTAVFGVVKATLLSPLPYGDADRLVRVHMVRRGEQAFLPAPVIQDFRARTRTLEGIAAIYNYSTQGADLSVGGTAERVRTLRVNADYFDVLDARPVTGRGFRVAEERADARVAVLSRQLHARLTGNGQSSLPLPVTLDGEPYDVVGVLPAAFEDPLEGAVDVWLPLPLPAGLTDWDNNSLSAIARVGAGSTIAEVRAELDLLNARQRAEHPELGEETTRVVPLKEDVVGGARATLLVLTAAVTLLLVIACVNVASLFLVRGAAREQELAVRSALGSSRGRLVRQLLVESTTFALAGGAAGLLLARLASAAMVAAAPAGVAPADARLLDPVVFLYGFGCALVAGLVFGIAPALQFARPGIARIMREGGRGLDSSRRATRARSALVIGEFALALVLLISAGILLRNLQRLRALDDGVRAEHVLTFQVNLPDARYADPELRTRFHDELHRRIATVPGVIAAGATSRLPATGSYHPWTVRLTGRAEEDGGAVAANQRIVAGDYFAAVGMQLVAGRFLRPEDRAGLERRVVVSRALAERFFPREDPVGRQFALFSEPLTIVGVVADVPITPYGDVVPMVYHAHAQFADNRNWALTQVVSVERDDPTIVEEIRRLLAELDPQLVLYQPRPLTEVMERGISRERFATLLIGTFALLALTLAAIGIYGVLAYTVSCRRREIGIRLALGARPAGVRRMVVAYGARLALAGLGAGVAAAFVATRALEALVLDVSVRDPLVFVVATCVLGSAALAASWIPAYGATRVDLAESFGRE